MLRSLSLKSFIFISAVFMGCANDGSAQKKIIQERHDKLAEVALSEALYQNADLIKDCDAERASDVLDDAIEHEPSKAADLWRSCQMLYACSPTAKNLMSNIFKKNASFKVGFADLKKLNVSSIGSDVQALYLSGTNQVYLDTSLSTSAVGCPLLLHELVHRFDPETIDGRESLRSEYRAYWYQHSFMQELFMSDNKLGEAIRAPELRLAGGAQASARMIVPPLTREKLLTEIARIYKFELDLSLLDLYPALPIEDISALPLITNN